VLVLSLLLACSEYDVQRQKGDPSPGDDTGTGVPVLEVTPPAIDFGALAVGATSEVRTITARNVGDALLQVGDATLEGAGFTLLAGSGALLAPDEATTFDVVFVPDATGAWTGTARITSDDPEHPQVDVPLQGIARSGNLEVSPASWDFGVLDPGTSATLDVLVTNTGDAPIAVSEVAWTSNSGEMTLGAHDASFGLLPGASRTLTVTYAPTDDSPDEGAITVTSDDPDAPVQVATQVGNGRTFEGFATGWYIVDDSTNFETTSNPSHLVDYHGESDGYWYEPSGAHGMVDSTDIAGDFAVLRGYVIARAGAPTPVSGPLTFRTSSSVPALTYASYSYVVCDFWIAPGEDPGRYSISMGSVDDGARVIVNGTVLGDVIIGTPGGSWSLAGIGVPGRVNTLAVILMDNAQVDKYLYDLAFVKDGVIVSGS
jgi:hypothetical protein